MEEPDLRELDGKVGEEDELGALPLLGGRRDFAGLDLVFFEVGHHVDYDPGQRATKVYDLMHHKGHDSRGKDIVLHVRVPRSPETLEDIEVDIVFGDDLKGLGVCFWLLEELGAVGEERAAVRKHSLHDGCGVRKKERKLGGRMDGWIDGW